jgi:hypothetical protein
MGLFKPDPPKYPDPIDPGESAIKYLESMADPALQRKLYEARKTYDPKYAEMELSNIANVMRGTGDVPGGLFGLLGEASDIAFEQEQKQLGLQREADVAALLGFAPQIVEGYREADPYSTQTADLQRQQAEQAYARAQGMSAQEERLAAQQARGESGARGRGFDQSSIASALMGREEMMRAKRAEATQQGQVAFGMDRTMAGDIGSVILGRPSSAMGLGQQMLGQATGMAPGMSSAGVFDIGTGVNLGLMNQQNLANYNANVYGAQAGAAGAMWGGLASGLGALGGGFAAKCWVAREVYGTNDDRWIVFRLWLESCAPKWFHDLYMKHGERFAKWVSNKPVIKLAIRKWMDGRIKQLEKGLTYGYDTN